ncbi:hypothetical protein OENI_60012 [Oenococcus oeni]|nr:hypothetical protein OENI_60012 [Oenococcus oeni]
MDEKRLPLNGGPICIDLLNLFNEMKKVQKNLTLIKSCS